MAAAKKKPGKKVVLPAKKKPGKAVAKKPAFKKPAPKVVAKKPGRPAAVAKAPKEKKVRPPADPTTDYRVLRKYTVHKLQMLLAERPNKATETAGTFLRYLGSIESDMPDWKAKRLPPADGVPRKRGRPRKADIEARTGKVKPIAKAAAKDAVHKAKAGTLMPAPRFSAPKPAPVAVKAFTPPAAKPAFKLPFKLPSRPVTAAAAN